MQISKLITKQKSINYFNTLKERIQKIHGNKYTYNKVIFIDTKTKVTITCPEHGDFEQSISSHLTGRGCLKCGIQARSKKTSLSKEEFITKSKLHYGDKYDYSKVVMKGNKKKVTVTCPKHGDFQTIPNNHCRGKAQCNKCKYEQLNTSLWSYTSWESAGKASKRFDSFKLYIIKCTEDDGTEFIKIGKTFTTVAERLTKSFIPYHYKILTIQNGNASFISKLEHFMHNSNIQHKYTPKKKFGGSSECYTIKANMLL